MRRKAGRGAGVLLLALLGCCSLLSAPPARADGACLSGAIDGSFSNPASSGSITSPAQVDCYSLSGADAGDVFGVSLRASAVTAANPGWAVTDGGGFVICEGGGFSLESPCVLTGASGWSLRVRDRAESGTFSYLLAARRLTDPQGCSSGLDDPGNWSFSAPRLNGSVAATLGAQCFTFHRAPGDNDGSYWLRAVRSAGNLSPQWSLYGPSGARECGGFNGSPGGACRLLASGTYTVVIGDSNGEATGSYFLTAKRLDAPDGCAAGPPVAFGSPPASGSIATAGEADCVSLSGVSVGDTVSVSVGLSSTSESSPRWAVLDANGSTVCEDTARALASPCLLAGTAPWSLVAFDEGGRGTFSYSLAIHRLSDPEGCSAGLGDPASWTYAKARTNGAISGQLGAQCFAFSRAEAEADGAYWFRTVRTAGADEPQWRVFGPSGAEECSGSSAGASSHCQLIASGRYALVVEDREGRTGSYFLTANRLNEPAGCADVSSLAFGAPAQSGSVASAGEVDCYQLAGASAGKWVSIGVDASGVSGGGPRWTLVDGSGHQVCDSTIAGLRSDCQLTGAAGWSLLVYGDESASFSYALVARALTDPETCSAALGDPGGWSFTAPRLNASITSGLGAQCFSFTRAPGETDGAYWFRALHSSGDLQPRWVLYGPSGARECAGPAFSVQPCDLTAAGKYALVVDDASGEGTGSYFLTANRLNDPHGCRPLAIGPFGVPVTRGSLAAAGEIDCYGLGAGSGDELNFHLSGAADQLALLGPEGEVQCLSTGWPCRAVGNGPFSLLFYSSAGNATGAYQFEAACENVPCGQTSTAINEVTPKRLGQGSSVTLHLRGHDLELLEAVTLKRGSEVVEGEVQQVPPDGRSAEVRFNLSGATVGSWAVEASFLDGTARQLSGAVQVEPPGTPIVSLQLVGREVFRTLHKVPVSIDVGNSGNVDAIGVPVVLSGLPPGSTVEPEFGFVKAEGDLENPTIADADFDSAEDALELENGMAIPMLVPRVPAGGSVQLNFNVTVPTGGVSYFLEARAGQCLGSSAPGEGGLDGLSAAASLGAHTSSAGSSNTPAGQCGNAFGGAAWKSILGLVPGVSCVYALNDVGDVMTRGIVNPLWKIRGPKVISWQNAFDFGLDTAGCFVPFTKVSKATKAIVEGTGLAGNAVDATGACYGAVADAKLAQHQVTAIDPNELVGPIGVGARHYISGAQPLQYGLFFENTAAASAPAQRIELEDQLDTSAFDASSVLFESIHFGHTNLVLPYPESSIDETIDLRPAENLLVHVTAAVDAGGRIEAVLQALDPNTLEPPADPGVGLLPPNVSPPDGEGSLRFTVVPLDPQSGLVLTNSAAITFDDNPPLQTGSWSNTIDRSAPAPTVAVVAGALAQSADVSWSGGDDASGIDLWKIEVSRDGGPFEFWRSAQAPGTDTFAAPASGRYSFRAIAYDGAGNTGQSGISGIVLGGESEPPPPGDQPPTSQPGASAGPSVVASASTVAPPPASRKPAGCRRGFKRKSVKGKAMCVKANRRHRHRR